MRHKNTLKELHRYLWAGSLAFGTDFVILFLLTSGVGVNYLISNVFGFVGGLAVSYLLCVKWVFTYRRLDNYYHEFLIFTAVAFVGLLVSELCMWLLVESGSVHYLLAKIMATAVVFMLNFALRKVALFARI